MNTIMQSIQDFINGPKKPQSVDSIMASFNDTITQLEELNDQCLMEARRQVEIISAAQARESAAIAESNRAKEVARKLKNIVS